VNDVAPILEPSVFRVSLPAFYLWTMIFVLVVISIQAHELMACNMCDIVYV